MSSPEALCIAGSRSRRNNPLKAKLWGSLGKRSDLLLAIPDFIILAPLDSRKLAVFDEQVEQTGNLASHGGDGYGSSQSGTQTTALDAQITLAS
jgi:hypothetical protein